MKMKNISVTEKTYDFLMDLSKELNSQKPRHCILPHFFQIQEEIQIPLHNGKVTGKKIYHNAFLTKKACREHIEENSQHYTKPVDFLMYAVRNPELEQVIEFLCELTECEQLHK